MQSAQRFAIPHTLFAYATLLWMVGCTNNTPKTAGAADSGTDGSMHDIVDLVIPEEWTLLPEDEDPYPSHHANEVRCAAADLSVEDDTFEINTSDCGYAVVGQPIQAAIASGDWLELMMYHSALAAIDKPAEAHFSLWVGSELYWEQTIPIPSAGEVYAVLQQVDWSADQNTAVTLHLHNHGANSWRTAYFRRLRDSAVPAGQPPFRGSDAPRTSP